MRNKLMEEGMAVGSVTAGASPSKVPTRGRIPSSSLYTTPISNILQNSGASYQIYADDTQLYISFSPALSRTPLAMLSSTLDLVHAWFTNNRLCLNPSKTEYILIGSPYQCSTMSSTAISISGNLLKPVASARNLGIIFDSDLSLRKYISSIICQTSFHHIRQL